MIGVGYEGRALPEFVDTLLAAGVTRLVDVRLTPVSRKAGFGKRALAEALAAAGIAYEHLPALGNPKANRAGFSGGPAELARARAVFAELLRQPDAVEAIDHLARLSRRETVAVMCFEADQARCHRDVVLAAVAER
jgi:uncharacterized protein (DUF488 family)